MTLVILSVVLQVAGGGGKSGKLDLLFVELPAKTAIGVDDEGKKGKEFKSLELTIEPTNE